MALTHALTPTQQAPRMRTDEAIKKTLDPGQRLFPPLKCFVIILVRVIFLLMKGELKLAEETESVTEMFGYFS